VGLEAWLNRNWYDGARSSLFLLPLSWLYGAVVGIRAWLYRQGWLKSGRPACRVVVVGNITVGGTGKTPLVIFLARALRELGFVPGVASRGYGSGSGDSPRAVGPESDPDEVGDEPVLIARRTGVPVVVSRDRVSAARALQDRGVDIVLCDDGLQHLRLGRDVEIAVVDGERRFGNGLLLPAGPLREPAARTGSVDLVVTNGGSAAAGELNMRLTGDVVQRLTDGASRSLDELAGERWHAVAGIGNPERFFRRLEEAGLDIERHAMADHAALTPGALNFGDESPVLMTEKDAVKCTGFARENHWYLPVEARFERAAEERLLAVVAAAPRPDDLEA
jgi:tetraacyldisaccharide 4'-kinase